MKQVVVKELRLKNKEINVKNAQEAVHKSQVWHQSSKIKGIQCIFGSDKTMLFAVICFPRKY